MTVQLIEAPTEADWMGVKERALVTVGKHAVKPPDRELKPIRNYEGLYEVSNDGRVRRVAGWRGNLGYRPPTGELKQSCVRGYMQITLYKNGEKSRYKVHRLVADAFIPNLKRYPQVNHIDGNKKNNKVENLEWVTQSQNMKHARDTGLCPNNTPRMRLARHNVGLFTQNILKINPKKEVIVKKNNAIIRYPSCRACAREFNVSASYISHLCKEKHYSEKMGASFEYVS